MLLDLVTGNESVGAGVVVYLLGDILNDFDMEDQEQLIFEVNSTFYSMQY